MSENPFRLPLKPRWLAATIERLLCLHDLIRFYDQRPISKLKAGETKASRFLQHTMNSLGASLQLLNKSRENSIPVSGATIFVANHPLGGLEGVALTQWLLTLRPDTKVLTNELLSTIPELDDVFIGVDVLSNNAKEKNLRGMRRLLKHLRQGGAVLIFPAGMVSALDVSDFRVRDRRWSRVAAKLMQQFDASCVPLFVEGRNSRAFYAAGLLHPRLRTLMLPREFVNCKNTTLPVTIGDVIEVSDIAHLNDHERVTEYLRVSTDLLASRRARLQTAEVDAGQTMTLHTAPTPDNSRADQLLKNIDQLSDCRLLSYREFDVFCAPYSKLSHVMPALAVAREQTFRAAGEGTGHVLDSDRFDPHYQHLFVWDRKHRTIVGGYRIGKVDEIVAQFGVEGLYSRTLYEYDIRYIQRIEGALEMGRSFVSVEYQKHPRALDLLWKGIGLWVAENPKYHTLFGCVSISREHSDQARELLTESLMNRYRAEQEMIREVRPVSPLPIRHRVWSQELLSSLNGVAAINKLLGQCDPGKQIPVLLRQYLSLNGRFVGFSINHQFSDSLDGLIIVDLRKAPMKYLRRYLGKQGSTDFCQRWLACSDKELRHAA